MLRQFFRLRGVERARLVSHLFATFWPVVFLLFQPSAYSIISDVIIHIWMPVAIVAGVAAAIGVITRIDLKLELPALYLMLIGPVMYFLSQIGLILVNNEFSLRAAVSIFALWHISLLIPRIAELEAVKRTVRLKAESRLK